ncbi:MAG: GvpL/GvpF family gas vesicle protein [Planctomycetota bacterium]
MPTSMHRKTILAFAAGAGLAALGLLAAPAGALKLTAPLAAPSSIGTVDLATVFDRLADSAEWDVRIRALESSFTEELRAKNAELEKLRAEIEAMPEGADRAARADAGRLRKLQFEEWAALKQTEIDREKSLKWQAVYRAVREGAKRLAETEKIDLVVVDDSRTEIRSKRSAEVSLEAQVQGQISQLRILHAAKTVDVTEKLIVLINNSRNAGAAAGAATTPR